MQCSPPTRRTAPLVEEPQRWRRYIADSLIETSISRDVLLLTRVDKPALLRRLFDLACRYSGRILSYTKMLGQLPDAGNTTTLAHYLELVAGAGMVSGLQKFAGDAARSRGPSPKLQVLNTALMSATLGASPADPRSDPEYRGRLVESAVGAHLANAAACGECELFYWRERGAEVDFVVRDRYRTGFSHECIRRIDRRVRRPRIAGGRRLEARARPRVWC